MQYLTVGTREISRGLFRNVEDIDSDIMKPFGGLWFTEFDPLYKNYNAWIDFIIDNPNLLFYKNHADNIWEQPCSVVTLNEDANIFRLDDFKGWQYLYNKFPYDGNKFSYKKLSLKYDAIYVDILKLFDELKDDKMFKLIRQFGVSSLILFDLDCIDYYQSGIVSITPFDLEYRAYDEISYEINYENVKKRILNQ